MTTPDLRAAVAHLDRLGDITTQHWEAAIKGDPDAPLNFITALPEGLRGHTITAIFEAGLDGAVFARLLAAAWLANADEVRRAARTDHRLAMMWRRAGLPQVPPIPTM